MQVHIRTATGGCNTTGKRHEKAQEVSRNSEKAQRGDWAASVRPSLGSSRSTRESCGGEKKARTAKA
eukprot:4651742-Pleurochrysis_carterae.AAC.1